MLAKALKLPVPIPLESPDERMIRLEGEVSALADMFFEEICPLKEKRPVIELRIDGLPMKIEPATAPVVQLPTKTGRSKVPSRRYHVVDSIRHGESIGVKELASRTGRSVPNVSATLQYWKKKGVVENKDRKWRRVEGGAEGVMRADPAGPDLDG
jgi:hypothetical protein